MTLAGNMSGELAVKLVILRDVADRLAVLSRGALQTIEHEYGESDGTRDLEHCLEEYEQVRNS